MTHPTGYISDNLLGNLHCINMLLVSHDNPKNYHINSTSVSQHNHSWSTDYVARPRNGPDGWCQSRLTIPADHIRAVQGSVGRPQCHSHPVVTLPMTWRLYREERSPREEPRVPIITTSSSTGRGTRLHFANFGCWYGNNSVRHSF